MKTDVDFTQMLNRVARQLELSNSDILRKSRELQLVEARFILFQLLSEAGKSITEIAILTNRDRSTVYNGLENVKDWVVVDPDFKRKFNACKTAVYGEAN